jgi:hypothetical protein
VIGLPQIQLQESGVRSQESGVRSHPEIFLRPDY